ncbi:MAG: histidinol phosphate phosphatase domain-containing protein [Euryarchaeota archaeon]|nr:histidinol phosphate phosphatase domain-containing protein [Euryarchaeota archaeon]
MYDLHVHSVLSDGELVPAEIARRYAAKGFRAVAITDHADSTNLEHLLRCLSGVAEELEGHGIRVLAGVELTHVPPARIASLAARAKVLGAELVLVHGESIAEPVAEGTNRAAIECGEVDILAHPGLITPEDAELAAENGVLLELSLRRGHCLTNGHVARAAAEAGAELILGSDAHSPNDIPETGEMIKAAMGAGLSRKQSEIIANVNPESLLK